MRVVLVHGFVCSARLMRPQVDFLRALGHDAVAPNLPFHGGPSRSVMRTPSSARSVEGVEPSLEGLARWLTREHLREPAVLAGHSLGGMIAQQIALDRPDAVAGIVLLASFPSLELNREVLPGMFVEDRHGPVRRWIEAERAEILARMTPAMHDTIWPSVVAFDARPRLAEIGCPLLGVYGGRGRYGASQADELRGALQLDRLGGPVEVAVVPDSGHFAHLERPEAVNAALRAWLPRIDHH